MGSFRKHRCFRGIHTVFLRRTKKNLWHPPHIQSATFFTASLFVCSRSTGEEVDLTGPDTNPLGFSMSTQRPSNLLYLILLLLHTWSLSACSLSSFLCPPFGIPVSLSLSSLLPYFPHCSAFSILAWVIDFCKGWVQLLPSFLFSIIPQLSLLSSRVFLSFTLPSLAGSTIKKITFFFSQLLYFFLTLSSHCVSPWNTS